MLYDTLGNTDVKVSKICLGTMTYGQQNTEEEAHEQLDYALTQGINFIDTAEMYSVPPRAHTYGLTEKYIGTWLQKRGKRDDLIIASKIVGPRDVDWVRPSLDFKPDSLRKALDGSLRRLQTDYIDLYQLHWPERKTNFFGRLGYTHRPDDPWEDNFLTILQTLQELKSAGKIRYIGLSNETPWGTMRFLQLAEKHDLPRIVSVQNPYNLLNRSYEIGLAEVSMREQVSCLPYSPLAFGLLSGKYHDKTDTPENRINQFDDEMTRYDNSPSWEATSRYIQIARDFGITPTQLSLAFVNTQPWVTSNIIGATTMEQLKEDIASLDVDFTPEMLKAVNDVHAEISNPAP